MSEIQATGIRDQATGQVTVRTPEIVAAEIRTFSASMLNNAIEIGRRLVEAKELLPYGEFGGWVTRETGYSSSSANNFMRLYLEYGDMQGSLFGATLADSQTYGKLTVSKALELLALPAGEREEFVAENNVEEMSTRELRAAIRERDEARKTCRRSMPGWRIHRGPWPRPTSRSGSSGRN